MRPRSRCSARRRNRQERRGGGQECETGSGHSIDDPPSTGGAKAQTANDLPQVGAINATRAATSSAKAPLFPPCPPATSSARSQILLLPRTRSRMETWRAVKTRLPGRPGPLRYLASAIEPLETGRAASQAGSSRSPQKPVPIHSPRKEPPTAAQSGNSGIRSARASKFRIGVHRHAKKNQPRHAERQVGSEPPCDTFRTRVGRRPTIEMVSFECKF